MKLFQFFVGTVARKIPFDDPDTLICCFSLWHDTWLTDEAGIKVLPCSRGIDLLHGKDEILAVVFERRHIPMNPCVQAVDLSGFRLVYLGSHDSCVRSKRRGQGEEYDGYDGERIEFRACGWHE